MKHLTTDVRETWKLLIESHAAYAGAMNALEAAMVAGDAQASADAEAECLDRQAEHRNIEARLAELGHPACPQDLKVS